ncbi:MAG: hypothetical protein HYV07_04905 [Deltaproteobacteria bacterium]|nr:hypothetical protein [Deltaproteobacteria bacterium]
MSAEILEVQSRAARGDEDASEKLLRLEATKQELTDASIRHDLAARMALEGIEAITSALSTRTTTKDVSRLLEA